MTVPAHLPPVPRPASLPPPRVAVPQALQYRGIPFYTKPYGILNATGINEGIIQGSNFKPGRGREPIQFESSLMRSVKTVSTGAGAWGRWERWPPDGSLLRCAGPRWAALRCFRGGSGPAPVRVATHGLFCRGSGRSSPFPTLPCLACLLHVPQRATSA